MAIEIERKFLVKGDFKKQAVKSYQISQGFLSTVPERTVRVRIRDQKAFITVKGIGSKSGITRFEWEKEIEVEDAKKLLSLCEPTIINKIRYIIPTKNNLFFEVDEFLNENKGLIIAEIELPKENTCFAKPNWLGKEVTGKIKYYNAMLSKKPFTKW
jgi:adenylate cyclase